MARAEVSLANLSATNPGTNAAAMTATMGAAMYAAISHDAARKAMLRGNAKRAKNAEDVLAVEANALNNP